MVHHYFADLYCFLQILCPDIVTVGNTCNDIMYALVKTNVNTLTKGKQTYIRPKSSAVVKKFCASHCGLIAWSVSGYCRHDPKCPVPFITANTHIFTHIHTPDICVSDSLLTLFVLHGVCHDLDSCCRHTHIHTLVVVIGCYFYRFK